MSKVLILSKNDQWHKLEDLGARIARWSKELPDVETEACHDKEILAGDELGTYGICVLCATMSGLTEEQERGIVDFVENGGVLIGIHSATVVDEGRTKYIELIGGRFAHHSPYHEFPVKIEDRRHPVACDIDDFSISDELYVLDREPEGAHVLATAFWEDKAQPLVYTRNQGRGQVLYNALGHDAAAFDHPAFQKLVIQGLKWACEVAGEERRTMAISRIVAGQFARAWDTLREAVHRFPAEQWRTAELADIDYLIPARLAYHVIEAAEFYARETEAGFTWGSRFDVDWEAATPEQLPTQEQTLAYLDQVQSQVDAWLGEMSDATLLSPDDQFLWTGSAVLDRALYLLRHVQHHVGELNAELRRRGLPRAKWR